jgi:hypothetical protein
VQDGLCSVYAAAAFLGQRARLYAVNVKLWMCFKKLLTIKARQLMCALGAPGVRAGLAAPFLYVTALFAEPGLDHLVKAAISPADPMEYAFEQVCNRFDRFLGRLIKGG